MSNQQAMDLYSEALSEIRNLKAEKHALAELLSTACLLIKQYSEAGEVMPYCFQEKAAHEIAVKYLEDGK